MSKPKRKRTPKTVLRLPDLEQSKSAVVNSLASQRSQRSYDHAIREFIEWYCSEPRLAFNKTVVTRYRIFLEQAHYASSTINLRVAAVRRLAYEAADAGLLSPDLAAGIRRVKGAKKLGVRTGNWLTAEQGRRVLGVFDRNTLRGIRLIMSEDFEVDRLATSAQAVFDSTRAKLLFESDVFWARASIGDEVLDVWLDTYQTSRSFRKRGIVELVLR
jgi:hypothetical protein